MQVAGEGSSRLESDAPVCWSLGDCAGSRRGAVGSSGRIARIRGNLPSNTGRLFGVDRGRHRAGASRRSITTREALVARGSRVRRCGSAGDQSGCGTLVQRHSVLLAGVTPAEYSPRRGLPVVGDCSVENDTSITPQAATRAAGPPGDRFGTLAALAHSRRESRRPGGRHRRAPGFPDRWAGSRREGI